jgi:mannose-6-phosphate isomerase-like protein (cupin superfamily)
MTKWKWRWLFALVVAAGMKSAAGATEHRDAKPYHANVVELARENSLYRRVLFTGDKSQLVLMSIPVGDDIGEESHARVEQMIVCVGGRGRLSIDGVESAFDPGDVVVVTPGTRHDIRNVGATPLKLYTVYNPPNHIDQRVQATKAEAKADKEDEAFGHRVE